MNSDYLPIPKLGKKKHFKSRVKSKKDKVKIVKYMDDLFSKEFMNTYTRKSNVY